MREVPKVRTSHHRNAEEAARLQKLVDEKFAPERQAMRDGAKMMMTADIAQIISQGYASGKTAAEIAEEVAREFDRADAAQSNGDDEDKELVETLSHRAIDYALVQLCKFLDVNPDEVNWDAATETVDGDVQAVIGNILRAKFGEDWGPNDITQESFRSQLATAQATYLQFRTAHDEKMEKAREALELAEDVLSRAPMSTMIWPNGVHPQTGITQIRAALNEIT